MLGRETEEGVSRVFVSFNEANTLCGDGHIPSHVSDFRNYSSSLENRFLYFMAERNFESGNGFSSNRMFAENIVVAVNGRVSYKAGIKASLTVFTLLELREAISGTCIIFSSAMQGIILRHFSKVSASAG